jgi:hypothetical protein
MNSPSDPPSAKLNEKQPEIARQTEKSERVKADGEGPEIPVAYKVTGQIGRVSKRGWIELLRWLSGWAIVCWLGRLVAVAIGLRRSVEVELFEGTLSVHSRTVVLGRLLDKSEHHLTIENLQRVFRQVRYPSLPLAVGVVALSAGVLLGGTWAFEGVVSGELLLLAAAVVALLGCGLDLVLSAVVWGSRGRVAMEICAKPDFCLRINGVVLSEADLFLRELAKRLQNKDRSSK